MYVVVSFFHMCLETAALNRTRNSSPKPAILLFVITITYLVSTQNKADVGGLDAYAMSQPTTSSIHASNVTGALPQWWLDNQESLGQKIATRMRELGITTILR